MTRRPPGSRIVMIAAATTAAVALPLWLLFSYLLDAMPLQHHSAWVSITVGVSLMLVVLALPAVWWANVVARATGTVPAPVVRTTLRTALPMAVVVGISVDLSQFLITVVEPWHDLAVHVLFATAFSLGLGLFLSVVGARVRRTIMQSHGTESRRVWPTVIIATTVGVLAAAAVALPLGWQVRPWMGMRMLKPLYLVLVTGSATGGLALAHHLVTAAGSDVRTR